MAAPILLQGTNYHEINSGYDYILSVTDINGKVFQDVTVLFNQTGNSIDLYLPEIASLPSTNFSIKALAKNTDGGSYKMTVRVADGSSDVIGSKTSVDLAKDGANAVFTVVDSTTWSVIYSI